MSLEEIKIKRINRWITLLSIVIPLLVAALFGIKIDGYDTSMLPSIYSGFNALTALVLLFALAAVKRGNIDLHKKLMLSAIAFSILFLLLYVIRHITAESTAYEGGHKVFYYIILISHVFLSVAVIPLVLITFSRALIQNFPVHKKWARIAFPVWLYVAISGVIVYLMISPYYS